MPVDHIKIPKECISANPGFTKTEIRLVVASMLLQINLPVFRADALKLKIKHLGTIHTHGNKKRTGKVKYAKKYNKKTWRKEKLKKMFSKEKLLL